MYDIDVGCSLKGPTASFTCKTTLVILKNAEKLVIIRGQKRKKIYSPTHPFLMIKTCIRKTHKIPPPPPPI